ncbi:serine hydrolase domain-containing protein [Streptomyces sp. VB1]|uniref:serine hydrolase domain-containing protein n=1 Tax=Streptomyces sp. VB1 TaxID=2986803 RepID=UPI0022422FE9|nr:serine hydrolase domain-containing protein [Streptomyces sp. VB1]UZI26641.1 beta-lactamase family protein [Streptomyces sp. VB1]
MLDHTSGIPAADLPGRNLDEWYAHRFDVHTPRSMVASATAKEREFAPGVSQHYLNINYTVLGLLIERVTGQAYARAVADRILRPLGLRSTYFPGADPGSAARTTGATRYSRRRTGVTSCGMSRCGGRPTGGRPGHHLDHRRSGALHHRPVRRAGVRGPLLEEMFTLPGASVRTYGSGKPAQFSAGLSVLTLGGRQVWGKTGGRWGYNTAVAATRDLSRTLVYSVGATDAKGKDMNATAMGIVVAAFGPPPAA